MSSTRPPSKIRAFIALKPPPNWVERLDSLQEWLRKGLDSREFKWVDPKQIHLTLRFLGSVPDDQICALGSALATASRRNAFVLEAGKLGSFPSVQKPRVLWLGLGGAFEQITALHADLARLTQAFGEPPDPRPFKPHLTLARGLRPGPAEVLSWLRLGSEYEPLPLRWKVREALLLRSHLEPHRATYETLLTVPVNA